MEFAEYRLTQSHRTISDDTSDNTSDAVVLSTDSTDDFFYLCLALLWASLQLMTAYLKDISLDGNPCCCNTNFAKAPPTTRQRVSRAEVRPPPL